MAQIEEQKRRKSQERMPSNEATGLNFFGRYYAAGGIPPNELRDQLLAQINEKEALKAKNREVLLLFFVVGNQLIYFN